MRLLVANPPPRCIFCAGTPLSQTHIWPRWLHKSLHSRGSFGVSSYLLDPNTDADNITYSFRSGRIKKDIFAQEPYLACERCNSGWMNDFERTLRDVMPAIVGDGTQTELSFDDAICLAGWGALFTILAEYHSIAPRAIAPQERFYLKRHRRSSKNWMIYVGGNVAASWYKRWDYHHFRLHRQGDSIADQRTRDSQISTCAIGNLLFQSAIISDVGVKQDYEASVRKFGLTRIWPPPRHLWSRNKVRLKLPPQILFDDEEVNAIANAFYFGLQSRGSEFGWQV